MRATIRRPVECVSKSDARPRGSRRTARACAGSARAARARLRRSAQDEELRQNSPQPTYEGRVERRAEDERVASRDELSRPSRTIPGAGSGNVMLGTTQPVFPRETPHPTSPRSSTRHGRAGAGQLPRAGKPDDATSDDDDRGALHRGNASHRSCGASPARRRPATSSTTSTNARAAGESVRSACHASPISRGGIPRTSSVVISGSL